MDQMDFHGDWMDCHEEGAPPASPRASTRLLPGTCLRRVPPVLIDRACLAEVGWRRMARLRVPVDRAGPA